MTFIPLKYEILKGLCSISNKPAAVQPQGCPGIVLSVLAAGQQALAAQGWSRPEEFKIVHNKGFFFEDAGHDWLFQNRKFHFFSRVIQSAAQADSPDQIQTVDVMVVYAWLSRQMDSNGQEDGRSTLKSISHGFTTTIEICRQKCSPGKWQATLSAPSRSDMTLDQARDVMSAELDLVTLAESELAFRRRGIVRDQVNLEVEESSLSPSA